MLNVDTHILLFMVAGALTPAEEAILARQRLGISAIVLWEITKLRQRRRITRGLEDPDIQALLEDLTVWPVDTTVCQATLRLDFQSDPADELIAATSLAHGVPLMTRDRKLRSSTVVPLVRA